MSDLRGERGLAISRSPEAFKRAIPELLHIGADERPPVLPDTELLQHLRAIEERIHFIEISIHPFMKQSVLRREIAQIPGIGTITATGIVAAIGRRAPPQRPASGCLVGPGIAAVLFPRQVAPVSHQPAR